MNFWGFIGSIFMLFISFILGKYGIPQVLVGLVYALPFTIKLKKHNAITDSKIFIVVICYPLIWLTVLICVALLAIWLIAKFAYLYLAIQIYYLIDSVVRLLRYRWVAAFDYVSNHERYLEDNSIDIIFIGKDEGGS